MHPCDGNCLRSFHFGLSAEEASPGQPSDAAEKDEGTEDALVFGYRCNPMDMPEDLAMHFQVSPYLN